jgi:CheY-like chemotaxis protein
MKKILVIDDLPENVFMLQDRLEHEGYEVSYCL